MSILLTGGAGRTAVRIGRLLQSAKTPFVMTSRKGRPASIPSGLEDAPFAVFDFTSSHTYDNPFDAKLGSGTGISAIYLISPHGPGAASDVNSFIDHAVEKHGVKRVVLLANQGVKQDDTGNGKIWQHLVDIGLEHAVLAPTWFNENFSSPEYDAAYTIRKEHKIYSASKDGKAPFVSADDIAAVAFRLLTANNPFTSGKYDILGPELLTYSQVAEIFTKTLGRKIEYIQKSQEERVAQLIDFGYHEGHAKGQAFFESITDNGYAEKGFPDHTVEEVTGHRPKTMEEWVEENKDVWMV